MTSSSWNMFDSLPGPSSITETLVSGAKALSGEYQSLYPALFPTHHTLKKCFERLQEIRALLDGLSEHRRHKIQIASQRGACCSLQDLELELDKCICPNPIAVFSSESEMCSGSSLTTAVCAGCMSNRRRLSAISQASDSKPTSLRLRTNSMHFIRMHGKRPRLGIGPSIGGPCSK